MTGFTFTLTYRLPGARLCAGALELRLAEAGCDDALLGIGRPGRFALEFCRQAANVQDAVSSALADVRRAVPVAELIDVSPELAGLIDVAALLARRRR
ncbi:MAG TPA: hypothetical protein DCP40_02540 [Stenotrophomonas sp.]|nr:hypothetical protein [Stenotrophomonas sp.]